MKSLIVGDLSSAASLSYKLAQDHSNYCIDYIGSQLNHNLKNLNYIDSKKFSQNYQDDITEFIKSSHCRYDFIYAHDLIFQKSHKFQNLRSKIRTPILCPEKYSASLENSKLYAKKIMHYLGIPCPDYIIYNDSNREQIKGHFAENTKAVLKIDEYHIPTGHGTYVCHGVNYDQWVESVRKFCPDSIIFLETFIEGRELSFHLLSNGSQWIYLGSARDYKKIRELDQGINTISTGSYSPVDYFDDIIYKKIESYVDRLIGHLNYRGEPYIGILYLGVLIDRHNEPWILELNTRPGNPEFASILPTLGDGLLENLYRAARREHLKPLGFNYKHAVSVQLLHRDYSYTLPKKIEHPLLDLHTDLSVNVFERFNLYENIYACITSSGTNRQTAVDNLYGYLDAQDMGTYRFRRDIGIYI